MGTTTVENTGKEVGSEPDNSEKGFVWWFVRIGPLPLIIYFVLEFFFFASPESIITLISLFLFPALTLILFISSMAHLRRYSSKGFARVALTVSSLFLLLVLVTLAVNIYLYFS